MSAEKMAAWGEIGQSVSTLFKRRQWEKEELDFRASAVKQFEKRIMAAGMLAAQSTPDDNPDAPAEVPKEIIMGAYDLKMTAALRYPNNPLIANAADTLYQNAIGSVKSMLEAQKQVADIQGTEATTQFNTAQAEYKEGYNKAGGAEADVALVKSQARLNDRMPAERGGGDEKLGLFLGLPPQAITNVDALYDAMIRYERLPKDAGGPDQDAVKRSLDISRSQIASERMGHLAGKKNPLDPSAPATTIDELAAMVPPEDAMRRARYEQGYSYARMLGGERMAAEWKDKYGHLLSPGMSSPVSGSPGVTMPESGIMTLMLGQDKIKQLETDAGVTRPVGTVKETEAILPKSFEDLMSGDGTLPATMSSVMYELDSNKGMVEQVAQLPAGQRREAIKSFISNRGEMLINDLLKIPRGTDPNKIPEPVRVSKRQAMMLVDKAANKYADQILMRLGLIELGGNLAKGTNRKFGKEVIDSLGKLVDESAMGKLIKGSSDYLFGKDVE